MQWQKEDEFKLLRCCRKGEPDYDIDFSAINSIELPKGNSRTDLKLIALIKDKLPLQNALAGQQATTK
jgi:hypothetical protein